MNNPDDREAVGLNKPVDHYERSLGNQRFIGIKHPPSPAKLHPREQIGAVLNSVRDKTGVLNAFLGDMLNQFEHVDTSIV